MATARVLTAFSDPEPIRRLTVEQYRQMSEAGILDEDDAVELLEGLIVEKVGKNPPHIACVRKTYRLLLNILPEGWFVDSEQPVDTEDSEPEPDFAIIRGEIEDYKDRIPQASDVGLVIEVADSTLQRDRLVKLRIYGRAGIPAYWIVNLDDRLIEVHSEPYSDDVSAGYSRRVVYAADGVISLILDGVEVAQVAAADMLP